MLPSCMFYKVEFTCDRWTRQFEFNMETSSVMNPLLIHLSRWEGKTEYTHLMKKTWFIITVSFLGLSNSDWNFFIKVIHILSFNAVRKICLYGLFLSFIYTDILGWILVPSVNMPSNVVILSIFGLKLGELGNCYGWIHRSNLYDVYHQQYIA